MANHSNAFQLELILTAHRFTIAQRRTTRQIRLLIKALAGIDLSAQEILLKGKSERLRLSCPNGRSNITSDSKADSGRWLWNIEFIPEVLNEAA